MKVRANKFTPEVLLSAPRRTAGTPNADGKLALFTVSTYSFETHSKTNEIRLLDIKTGQTTLLASDLGASEPTWLGENNLVLWLKGGEKGTTNLILGNADNSKDKWGFQITILETIANLSRGDVIQTYNGSVSNLKVTRLDADNIALAVTGLATPDGKLYNAETAEKPKSTAKIYDKLFVRQWDAYVTENTSAIWYTVLTKNSGASTFSILPLKNALTGHSFTLESPVPPFGGAGDFDISKNGIVFIAKDPKLDPANHTKTDLYYIPLRTYTEPQAPSPQIVKTGNLKGYSSSPVFSPDAKSLVFARMKSDQYESDKPRLLLVPDITDLSNVQEFYETKDGVGKWDLRPETIAWSNDGEQLYVTAEENGRGKLVSYSGSLFCLV